MNEEDRSIAMIFFFVLLLFATTVLAQNKWGGTYYDENGQPEYLTETQDGYYITEDGEFLLPDPYVDEGGDINVYNTETEDFEYYYDW